MAPSPPRNPPQPPPIFTTSPSQILTTITTLISTHRAAQSSIPSTISPQDATYANTLLPLAHAENALYSKSSLLLFHNAVSPDQETRTASSQARSLLRDAELQGANNEALFKLVDAVYNDSAETRYLNPEARNYLHKKHREFVKNGLRIPIGPDLDRFRAIRAEIVSLTAEFAKNLAEADVSVWFTPRELDGFPPDALACLEEGDDDNPETAGKFRIKIPLHLSHLLRTAHRPNTRRRARLAYDIRCSENIAIFRRVVLLRHEAARLLGYPDHATLSTEEKMAGSPAHVTSFLSSLREKLVQGGQVEKERLLKLKRRDVEEERGEIYDGKLYTWDTAYYTNQLLKEGYAVDQERIAEYFPLEQTVEGMLSIFERLFGMEFCEIAGREARDALSSTGKGEDIVWHEDVRLFSAWDSANEGGGFLGYLYLDLYHRDGKYGNPANFSLVPLYSIGPWLTIAQGFTNPDQTRTYPSTALLCSFPTPSSASSPTLLRHADVVTLFHELGHAIHDLVSRTSFARFHGPMGTVVDFGEAPSQMLENWCWSAEQLRGLGRHYSFLSEECLRDWREKQVIRGVQGEAGEGVTQPPERIPESVVEGLVAAKHVGQGLGTLQQLFISVFDMAVHQLPASTITQEDPTANAAASAVEGEAAADFTTLWNSLRREIVPTDDPPFLPGDDANWGHGYTNIGHLMDEYDAGFYGYFFSKVYAQDIFSTIFESDPMSGEAGRKYRYGVLEKGGGQPEMTTLLEFLGREVRMEPFYKELGLSA
ncbi:metallopeptidase MepB [Colletotrichum scovillei]|uniref:Metallopeptidase MepB n=1 Tax=Colletotrichum scovillei TaxID=1209932 RepID=A0A9P7QTA3_9PEZI|nr:metallopeptidase MepB [Colletotrichum scovillei]KAG7043099.1 metallopeptidase MepB [Colletotrichum scovillei]KAG7062546.1 metallopeptidase MepB [Colletotrichum scovillei]